MAPRTVRPPQPSIQNLVVDDRFCVNPNAASKDLGAGGVGVVVLEVVALHDTELDFVVLQRLAEQPAAHPGFAQARSAAEA